MLGNVRPNEERLSEGHEETYCNQLTKHQQSRVKSDGSYSVRHRLHAGHGSFIISGGHNIGEKFIEPDAESLTSTSHKHEEDLGRSV
jgi:hypothetical protein